MDLSYKYLVLILVILSVSSCRKTNVDPVVERQDVVFVGQDLSSNGGGRSVTACDNPAATYAVVVIDGVSYRPNVFYIASVPFTEVIKLLPGEYNVEEFLLMNDAGTPGILDDDIIVQATPEEGSEYAQFVSNPVSFPISVMQYEKTEVPVEVICFEESDFSLFGFDWFTMNEITVRSQWIYGSICVSNPDDYAGSLYEEQSDGLQEQMPAISRIDVYRNGVFLLSYDNVDDFGEQAFKIMYPDHDNAADHFDFELNVLVKSCGGFEYKLFSTWTVDDDELMENGDNGQVDFVVGDCDEEADYQISAYETLPEEAKFKVKDYGPGTLGTFVDIRLRQIDEGYLIENETYAGWNGEHSTIDYNNQYNDESYFVDVYSSECDDLPEAINVDQKNWPAVNWLVNHLDQYSGYQWDDLQAAFWLILDLDPAWDEEELMGVRPLAELQFAQQMHDDAVTNGPDFIAAEGEKYAVIFYKGDDDSRSDESVQIHFIFITKD